MKPFQDPIEQWLAQSGLSPAGSGAFDYRTVVIDQVRVRLATLASGALLIESYLKALPISARDRETLIEEAIRISAGRIPRTRARLVADAQGAALWLQVSLPGMAGVQDIDTAIEDLVNEVERWRKAI